VRHVKLEEKSVSHGEHRGHGERGENIDRGVCNFRLRDGAIRFGTFCLPVSDTFDTKTEKKLSV